MVEGVRRIFLPRGGDNITRARCSARAQHRVRTSWSFRSSSLVTIEKHAIAECGNHLVKHCLCVWSGKARRYEGDHGAICSWAGTGAGKHCTNNECVHGRCGTPNPESQFRTNIQPNRPNCTPGIAHAVAMRQTGLVVVEEECGLGSSRLDEYHSVENECSYERQQTCPENFHGRSSLGCSVPFHSVLPT
jgi:hypothetical protein